MVCASKKTWDKLSDADRDIMAKASAATEKFAQQTAAQKEAEAMQIIKDKGATISEVANRQEWGTPCSPSWKNTRGTIGA
jgi:TRAP-type C4-dicarboxylate transport system substrate-binding protein